MSAVSADRPSVALVVLDTLRKDAFDEQFDWLPGRRYENAWAPSHWTTPVHASLLCGRYASELGVHAKHQSLDCPEETLGERLRAAGYTTRAFSCNVNVSSAFGFDRGFDEFAGSWRLRELREDVFDWESFIAASTDEGPTRYLRALQECIAGDCATVPSLKRGARIKLRDLGFATHEDDGGQEAVDYVRSTDFGDEEFLFVNLMEAHAPYTPPESYRTTDVENLQAFTTTNGLLDTVRGGVDDPESLRQAYDDSVRYLSAVYRDMFAELKSSFDIVLTLSDHGECFGEYGAWKHAYGVFPALTHVPLVVSGTDTDGERYEGTTDRLTSLLDVHATVLDAAGVDVESDGRPLEHTPADRVATEYHGLYHRNRAKVESEGYDPSPYDRDLFGAVVGRDYGFETIERFETVPDDADDDVLGDAVEDHRERIDPRTLDGRAAVSEQVRRQLEDLGYA
jgi:arylsulfatase